MTSDPMEHVLMLLAMGADTGTRRLCEVSAEVTGQSGAGIMIAADNMPLASLGTTGDVAAVIEDLQYTLGEGPCVDAHRQGVPVLEPDLASPAVRRWPAFAPAAVEAGARAVFGFPVRVGAARLGALNLYRDRPGPLTDDQQASGLMMADVIARALLALQADAATGTLAAELDSDVNLRFVVHQAAGMISVQLGVSLAEAMIRLRAYAFRTGRSMTNVAEDVVHRRLRLDDGGRE